MKTYLALLLMSLSMASFANDKGGNGGGGICNGKKCITLAEAGFRIPTMPEIVDGRYEVPYQILEELDQIISLLPKDLSLFSSKDVIGNKDSVVLLETINDRRTTSFLKEYKKILSSQGSDLANSIEILAFTVPSDVEGTNKTYLIKDKFDQLSLRSQALLFVHEYNLRVRKMNLKNALTFDGALVDYLNAVENGLAPKRLPLMRALQTAGVVSKQALDNEILRDFVSRQPIVLDPTFFAIKKFDESYRPYASLSFSYENIIRMKKYFPELGRTLNEEASYYVMPTQRNSLLEHLLWLISDEIAKSPTSSMTVSNELFSSLLLDGESWSKDFIAGAKLCGDRDDDSLVLTIDEKLKSMAFAVECEIRIRNYTYNNQYFLPVESLKKLFQNMKGLSLNLDRKVVCTAVSMGKFTEPHIICK